MRELRWVASSKKDLLKFPDEARREAGFAIEDALRGLKHQSAKPLKDFGGASVMEIVCDDEGDAYRVVYATRFPEAIYVLHSFQKKSTRGKKTPDRHIELIHARLKDAEQDYRKRR
jgi:phage-related protein